MISQLHKIMTYVPNKWITFVLTLRKSYGSNEKLWVRWKLSSGRASHIWANSEQFHSACNIFLVLCCSDHKHQMSESSFSSNLSLLAMHHGKLSKGNFLLYMESTNPMPTSKFHYHGLDPLKLGYLKFLLLEIYSLIAPCTASRMCMARLVCL